MVQYLLIVYLKDQYGKYVAGEVSIIKDATTIISYAPASNGMWAKTLDAATYKVQGFYPQITRTQKQEATVLLDREATVTLTFTVPTAPPPPSYNVTIRVTAGGTTNPAPGLYTHPSGTVVSITALPYSGYDFSYWLLNEVNVGSTNPISISITTDTTLDAIFTRTVPPPPPPPVAVEYTLIITSTLHGTTNPIPGEYKYLQGTMVSVAAIAQENYFFDHWTLDGVNIGSANPVSFNMNTNHTLEAVFTYSPPPEVPVAPPVTPPPEEVPPSVEIIPSPPPLPTVIPPAPEVPLPPVTPETAGLIVLGASVVIIIIIGAIWYFTQLPPR